MTFDRWFGKSWGAACCEAEAHAPTPVGRPCMHCREPILEGSQGLIHPVVGERIGNMAAYSMEPTHLDCFLKTIRPHGPECPHCRGAERIDHDRDCAYRVSGDNCTCIPMPEGKR